MTSIQERLQLKRVPLDTWSTKEKLCLASSVIRSGDQNWMSVSRALKSFGDANRPADWFSQKSCAAQYDALLGPVEKPKRKSRTPDGAAETPEENIIKKLTNERMDELQKKMSEMREEYRKLQDEIDELQNENPSDDRILEMWNEIEAEKRQEEREKACHAQWIRERDDRKSRVERSWRPSSISNVSPSASQPGSSPLLTSLLKSPSPAPTVSQAHLLHIAHPSTIPDTLSPSAGAPTLSMLLEKPAGTVTHTAQLPALPSPAPDTNKNAIIEQIKSDLQQIEKDFIGSMSAPILTPAPVLTTLPNQATVCLVSEIEERAKTPEKIDIDDIEIKEEDVYAFSDIDLDIPPVSSIHKSIDRGLDKSIFKKETSLPVLEDLPEPQDFVTEPIIENPIISISQLEQNVDGNVHLKDEAPILAQEQKLQNVLNENIPLETIELPDETTEISNVDPVSSESPKIDAQLESLISQTSNEDDNLLKNESQSAELQNTDVISIQSNDDHPKSTETPPDQIESATIPIESNEIKPDENVQNIPGIQEEKTVQEENQLTDSQDNVEIKVEPDAVEVPLLESIDIPCYVESANLPVENDLPLKVISDSNIETEEDHPMEQVAREEEKLGRTRRDYSRKKTERDSSEVGQIDLDIKTEPFDEITDNPHNEKSSMKTKIKANKSRSESPLTPIDSLPGSPGTPITPLLHLIQPSVKTPSTCSTSSSTEDDKDHRLWKKSVMLVYNRLCGHKNASLFLRPITDEQAPGYSSAVKRPMDLQTIKKQIDCGALRTTSEFHRDVLLMLSNALIYNSSSHHVFSMAQEMHHEAAAQLGMLLQAQAHAALSVTSTPTRRGHSSSSSSAQPVVKKKRGGDSTSSNTSTSSKKRKDDLNE